MVRPFRGARRFLGLLALLAVSATNLAAASDAARVYFGTYTRGQSQGIYLSRFDSQTGALSAAELVAELANPTFLAVHPSRPLLYAVGELGDFAGRKAGAVSALAIDPETGRLTLLSQQPSGGPGPCHLSVDRSGRFVLVANYSGGSIACLPIESDGRLGPATSFVQHQGSGADSRRQSGPHAHWIDVDPANRFALTADLGLDQVLVYRFDAAEGRLTPHDPPFASVAPGAGPRHFAFHPDGKRGYVVNEMASTVTAFDYDPARGVLTRRDTVSTLPADFTGANTTAEIQVHPSGRFVYASNRGHDSIAVLAIDPGTGQLRPVGHSSTRGKTPRHFTLDPTGAWLLAANQDSDTVAVFRVDPARGGLQPVGQPLAVPVPVCVGLVGTGSPAGLE